MISVFSAKSYPKAMMSRENYETHEMRCYVSFFKISEIYFPVACCSVFVSVHLIIIFFSKTNESISTQICTPGD